MAAVATKYWFVPCRDFVWTRRIIGAIPKGSSIQISSEAPFLIEMPPVTKGPVKHRSDEDELARLAHRLRCAREEYDLDASRRAALVAAGEANEAAAAYDSAQCVKCKGSIHGDIRFEFATHPGPRPYNEDGIFVDGLSVTMGGKPYPLGLFAVCDGHCAFRSENLSIRFLREHLGDALKADLEAKMTAGYSAAEMRRVLKRLFLPLQEKAEKLGVRDGTTVTLGISLMGKFWTVQLGDSGAEYHSPAGDVIPLTESADPLVPRYFKGIVARGGVVVTSAPPRSPEVPLVGRILVRHEEEGHVSSGINIARTFGDPQFIGRCAVPKITCINIATGGLVAIFSDGLTCSNSREDLSCWIEEKREAEAILQAAYEKGSFDNLSVLLVQLPRRGE